MTPPDATATARAAATATADIAVNARGLKVHLRTVAIGAVTYRVVSLRPATTARFSANFFHDTWHLLTGGAGALVLGRLLWGLAFQRQPGTLLMIDAPHLVPTPFEADRADPIVVVPAGLTRFDVDHLRTLRRRLGAGVPTTTVRWHTFGLPRALTADGANAVWRRDEYRAERAREQMSRRAGLICYTAPPDVLRAHAAAIYQLRDCQDMSYHPLAEAGRFRGWGSDGEVQVFARFDDDVAAATIARREVLAGAERPLRDESERQAVWSHRDRVADRRRAARSRSR